MSNLADWALKGTDGKPYAPSALCYEHATTTIKKHVESRVLTHKIDWEPVGGSQWHDCWDEDLPCVLCEEEEAGL